MRKFVGVLSAGAVLAGAVAMSAGAADNTKIGGSYSYVDTSTCVDPVQVDGTYNQMIHTFYDNAGNATRFSFTGKVTVTYTNLTTGSTLFAERFGSGHDRSRQQVKPVMRGGDGGIFDNNGNFVATDGRVVLDSHGNMISVVGHQTDVCAMVGSSTAP